jgi:hypothetical protein
MRRSVVVFLSLRILAGLVFSSLLVQCQFDRPIEPPALVKGPLLRDPVFKSEAVKLIETPTTFNKTLATLTLVRPKDLPAYETIQKGVDPFIQSFKSEPTSFEWFKTGHKLVMVALFCNPIRIRNNEIDNKEDIVWLWATDKEDPGQINYNSGYKATYINNAFVLTKPTSLDPKVYVWSVWAWDDKGLSIKASSRELPIRITN